MTARRACGHALALALIGAVTVFINASSAERPLRRHDTALLPLLQTDNPYLLNGVDLRPEGMGAPFPLGQLRGQDLSGMDLRKALFSRRGLHGLRLRGTHLAQANFSCVPLTAVDLSGADMRETRFDFSDCPSPPTAAACPRGMELPWGDRPPACFSLEADLVGANLGGALLQGKLKPGAGGELAKGEIPRSDHCRHWLVIRGRLDGARFDGATLRCVALVNLSPAPVDAGRPAYAGLRFVQSDLDRVLLQEGNFVFSDFWSARVSHLVVNLPAANLRFSSLAQWQCPSKGCLLQVVQPGERPRPGAAEDPLSLNVSGSRIRSDLPLAAGAGQWPALLCNRDTGWTMLSQASGRSASTEVTCGGDGRLVRPGPSP